MGTQVGHFTVRFERLQLDGLIGKVVVLVSGSVGLYAVIFPSLNVTVGRKYFT
jgi:hypothetical protein